MNKHDRAVMAGEYATFERDEIVVFKEGGFVRWTEDCRSEGIE